MKYTRLLIVICMVFNIVFLPANAANSGAPLFNIQNINDAGPVLRKAAQEFGHGFADGLTKDSGKNLGQGLVDGLSTGLHENTKRGGNFDLGVNNLFGAIGRGFRANTESGSDLDVGMGNVFRTIGSQFEEGGEGQRARRAWGSEMEEVGTHMGNAGHNMIMRSGSAIQKNLALSFCITVIGVAFITTAYQGIKILWQHINRKMQKPRLLIESSSTSVWKSIKNWFVGNKKQEIEMALPVELRQKLDNIVRTTKTIKRKIKTQKRAVKYRNLLLWGPPGTGKSMFARKLAYESGMDFAAITGSSLSAFKNGTAITEIDNLFAWAQKSKKGLLIWIDEVDSLLGHRNEMRSDSEEYKIVNHILNYTGERSNKFMVVMTTNYKDTLDAAIFDRVDDMIEMPLPSQEYRLQVLNLHINSVIFDAGSGDSVFVEHARRVLTPVYVKQIAHRTQGLSNRNLTGIVNKIVTDADATEDGIVTRALVDAVVQEEIQKHAIVAKMMCDEEDTFPSAAIVAPHCHEESEYALAA